MFARAARRTVSVPDDLAGRLAAMSAQRVVEGLTLARRAGQALSGFVKCREWIVAGRAGLVIQGDGGSADELARLKSGARDLPVITMAADVLARAFGREHAVYAVVASGTLARRLMDEHERYSGLTDGSVPGVRAAGPGLEQAGT